MQNEKYTFIFIPNIENMESALPLNEKLKNCGLRHTANFRFNGRHYIGDLMAHTMVWKLLYSEYDR